MLFLSQSATVYGIDALVVDIEVALRPSNENDQSPNFTVVGLPDTAIRESRERIRAAITNSRYFFPIQKITVKRRALFTQISRRQIDRDLLYREKIPAVRYRRANSFA